MNSDFVSGQGDQGTPRRRSTATPHKRVPQINAEMAQKPDSLLVNLGRVEQRVGVLHPLAILPLDIEAAPVAGVAGGRAVLLDLDHHRVGVAVGQYLPYLLGVPRLLPLHPVLVAGAAEEPGLS